MSSIEQIRDEQWKPCPDFEDTYEVSTLGRVRRSVDGAAGAKSGRFAKQHAKGKGYLSVHLRRGGSRQRTHWVHLLVARAFLGQPEPSMEVNHKNGDKADNSLGNLEWTTRSENAIHASRVLGTWPVHRGENGTRAILKEDQVREIYRRRRTGEYAKTIAVEFGVAEATVRAIALGTTWKHLGLNSATKGATHEK